MKSNHGKKQDPRTKTWDNGKTFFSDKSFDLKEDNNLGTKQFGYLATEIKKSENAT